MKIWSLPAKTEMGILVRKLTGLNYIYIFRYTIVIQQAFSTDWKNFMPSPQYQNVILDLHTYQVFFYFFSFHKVQKTFGVVLIPFPQLILAGTQSEIVFKYSI